MIIENTLTLVLLVIVLCAIAFVCLIIGIAACRKPQQNPRQSRAVSYTAPSGYNGKPSRYDEENDTLWED